MLMIHPALVPSIVPSDIPALSDDECLLRLSQAIAEGGTTLNDFADGEGNSGYFQVSLGVYGREGEPCPSCGTPIRRIVQDQDTPRGMRFEMLNMRSGAPCTNLREVVFGPDADVRHTFDEARRTWARFASDSSLLDMMYRSSEQIDEILVDRRQRMALGPAGLVGSILRNRRLAGCTVGLTVQP